MNTALLFLLFSWHIVGIQPVILLRIPTNKIDEKFAVYEHIPQPVIKQGSGSLIVSLPDTDRYDIITRSSKKTDLIEWYHQQEPSRVIWT